MTQGTEFLTLLKAIPGSLVIDKYIGHIDVSIVISLSPETAATGRKNIISLFTCYKCRRGKWK